MATSDNWGQGSKNNDNGWGKGASNNSNGWGAIHAGSYGHPTTNLTGEGGFVGLLDLYPNAAFATGMRLLRADYSGGLLRIIAYDGATEQGAADIMPYKIGDNYWVDFNSKLENLDATATARGLTTNDTLADLCSVGVNNYDGLCPAHRDQVAGNDMLVTDINRMPRLVTNGVMETEGGRPILRQVNDTTGMLSQYNPNSGLAQKTMLIIGQNSDSGACVFGSQNGGTDYGYIVDSGSTSSFVNNNPTVNNDRINGAEWNYTTRDDVYQSLLNQSLITNQITFNFNTNNLAYGYRFDDNVKFNMISMQSMVIWEGTPSQIDIETNANNAYNIY